MKPYEYLVAVTNLKSEELGPAELEFQVALFAGHESSSYQCDYSDDEP